MKCYEGDLPYIFVSYVHKDFDLILPILSELQNRGYRIWYDTGIHLGDEWPESIAQHLNNAESVIFFISQNFCSSKNCKREVNFAIDKDKDCFSIFLEETDLSLGLQLQLGTIQSIFYKDCIDVCEFVNKIVLNKTISKDELIMSKIEFESFWGNDVPNNSLINQMTIAIGLVKYNGCVLMVKRKNKECNLSWGFPATMIKPQENIEERVVKETFSETNVRTRFLKFIGKRIHPDTKTITYYCALEYINGDVENRDEYENADAKWVSIKDYKEIVTSDLYDGVVKYLEANND